MATPQDTASESSRERARIVDPGLRGIWILLGLLAMVGGTLVPFADLREAIAAWLPALFFVALGGYFLALGTVGFHGFKHGQSYRTLFRRSRPRRLKRNRLKEV